MNRTQPVIRCISCELSCELFPGSSLRTEYCKSATFAIWPEGNHYLKTGLTGKLLRSQQNHLLRGFIFVDFSFPNLRAFSDDQWIEQVAQTGLNIVIVADRRLAPLANYWLSRSNRIQGIVYSSDSEAEQRMKIRRLFTGRQMVNKCGGTLNYTEFTLLRRLIGGHSVRQAMKIDNIEAKKMYVHKFRLERKLGCSIHKIMTSIL